MLVETLKCMQPPIDLIQPSQIETATFSMGCFWGPEALYGAQEGVLRTRVGYAGGTTPDPTYWTLGEHIETVQLEFDPTVITFTELLQLFFSNHNPIRAPWKRQYTSALFFHSEAQKEFINEAIAQQEVQHGQPLQTLVYAFQCFYQAEDRHQKWKLRRHISLWQELEAIYPTFKDLNNSTSAARINGFAGGHYAKGVIEEEINLLGLSPQGQQLLQQLTKQTKPISCSN